MKKTILVIYIILSIIIMTPVIYCEEIIPATEESIPVESIPEEIIPEEIIPAETTTEEVLIPAGDTVLLPDGSIPAGGIITTTEAALTAPTDSIADLTAAAAAGANTPSITLTPANVNAGTLVPGTTVTLTRAATLSISSKNTKWNLTASGSNFVSADKSIPVERISIKVSTVNTYVPLTAAPVTLLSNQSGTSGNSKVTIYIDYQITLLQSDSLGLDFANNITFKVTPY